MKELVFSEWELAARLWLASAAPSAACRAAAAAGARCCRMEEPLRYRLLAKSAIEPVPDYGSRSS